MLSKIIDFAPAVAFFISYRVSEDLVLATGVIIACCLASFALQYVLYRKASRLQIFMICAVVIFGLPTILLKDPQIIKWKVTVVNLILSVAIFVCQYILKRNPFSYLFGKELPLPPHIWMKLGSSFMVYFVFVAALNVVIAFYLPALFGIDEKHAESLWVDYKTFGNPILNSVFSLILIFVFIKRYPEMKQALKDMQGKKDDKGDEKASATEEAQAQTDSKEAVQGESDSEAVSYERKAPTMPPNAIEEHSITVEASSTGDNSVARIASNYIHPSKAELASIEEAKQKAREAAIAAEDAISESIEKQQAEQSEAQNNDEPSPQEKTVLKSAQEM